MSGKKVPLAIVGTGEIGLYRGFIAKALPEYELVCIVENNRIMARLVGKQLGVPYYSRYKEAAKKENFSAVILSTPEHTHHDLAMEILDDKKNIFCEKPLSASVSDSKEMLQKAIEKNIVHQVGYTLRCHPTFMKTKEILESNALGEIKYIKVVGHTSEVIRPETRKDRKDREKRFGMYGSFSVHYIDLMLWFAGKVKEVFAYANRMFSTTLDDFLVAVMRFENGAVGNLDIGWGHHGIEKNSLSILLTAKMGSLLVDFDRIEIYREEEEEELECRCNRFYNSELAGPVGYELGGKNLSPEMENFARSILDQRGASPDWKDGYLVDEFVDSLNQSISEEKQVVIQDKEKI
jgi:predicted dehydrogenase